MFTSKPVQAQYSTDYQTNLISGVTSNWSGDYVVGNTSFADALLIQNGGLLSDANGYLGNFTSGSNNTAFVSGSGSVWGNGSSLAVGNSGSGNSLVISGGGYVVSASGVIGNSVNAARNSVLVTDPGSIWNCTNTSVWVGSAGSGNSLVISNGGEVIGGGDMGHDSSSSNNSILITGPGSICSNNLDVSVGLSGTGNSIVISNGGRMSARVACYMGTNPGSSSNRVVVTGSGSIWTTRQDRYVGISGSGNSLVISDGGQVFDNVSPGHDGCYVGYNSGSANNSVLVTGPGSLWNVRTNLYMGYTGFGNSLVISNGGQVVNSDAYMGYSDREGLLHNVARVVNGGVWQNNALYVGYLGPANSLFVSGGVVLATDLVIGYTSAYYCTNNLLELDSGSVIVTNASHNAILEVRNGVFILNGGTLQVDTLLMTNACGLFIRNGGTLIYSNLVLDPNLSAVGDGIPNGWKQAHGLDPLDPNVANEDPDGDGQSNLQEYLAGTDPTNKASSFRITSLAQEGNNLRVTWMTGTGKTNALQAAGGGIYATNSFTDIFAVTNTTGSLTNYLDAGAATNFPSRFYRVRVVP